MAVGGGLFLQGNGQAVDFAPAAGQTVTIAAPIADQSGDGGSGANAGVQSLLINGTGTVTLAAVNTFTGGTSLRGGILEINSGATAGKNGAISFSGTATLKLDGTPSLPNTIVGFAAGDTIDLPNIAFSGAGSAILNGQVLTVTEGASHVQLALAGAAGETFSTANDGAGGTAVTLGQAASTPTAQLVATAYQSILRTPPASDYANQIGAQIDQGQTTLAQFETTLIGGEQAIWSTLPVLVTIDAFYGATPSSPLLTTVTAATASPSQVGGFYAASYLHDLGYSDPNVWTILASQWGADPTSAFYQTYNSYGTNYSAFISAVYPREFGFAPSAANLQILVSDAPGVQALLSGGGETASPIQVEAGIYGYLLYAGQTSPQYDVNSQYYAAANAFLLAAANGTAVYGPELTAEFPHGAAKGAALAADGTGTAGSDVIGITTADQLLDPGTGAVAMRFMAGGGGDADASGQAGPTATAGFDATTDTPDVRALLAGSGIDAAGVASVPGDFAPVISQSTSTAAKVGVRKRMLRIVSVRCVSLKIPANNGAWGPVPDKSRITVHIPG